MLEGMLDAGILRHTRDVAMQAVGELSEEQLEATRSPGTLINSNHQTGLVACIGNPRSLAALEAVGLAAAGSGRRPSSAGRGPARGSSGIWTACGGTTRAPTATTRR